MIKTVFKQLHLWLSIPFGLVVTLICLSGAILIFERDFGHIGQAKVSSNGRAPIPSFNFISIPNPNKIV